MKTAASAAVFSFLALLCPGAVTGNYAPSFRVLDSAGRQASANMPITITTK
ncbi:hypothetical protein [Roseateles sp. PN1]|uniref:hypothetical protein n=1 Tax=Roseateles sp. PN1 TaxID=3137372 RepID=UPI003138E6D3